MQRDARLQHELIMIMKSPHPGVSCWQDDENKYFIHAQIVGPEDTPYCGGVFKLNVNLPQKYPFEPPKVVFVTPIYHPNIDEGGRICLDTLKMPPQGAWRPSLNISSVLTTILLLISEPNPEDPLMPDIAQQYKTNKPMFNKTAREWTKKFATNTPQKTVSDVRLPVIKLHEGTQNKNALNSRKRLSSEKNSEVKRPKTS